MDSANINSIYDKDPETITPEERKAYVEYLRAERIRFDEIEASGKRITKKAIAGVRPKGAAETSVPEEVSDEELLAQKVLG